MFQDGQGHTLYSFWEKEDPDGIWYSQSITVKPYSRDMYIAESEKAMTLRKVNRPPIIKQNWKTNIVRDDKMKSR